MSLQFNSFKPRTEITSTDVLTVTFISDADTEVQRRWHLVRVRAALFLTYKKPFFTTSHHYPRSKFCKMTPDMQPWGRWSFMPVYTVAVKLHQLCWKAGFNCSVAKSCLTLCGPLDCSTPSSTVLHCLPEFAQTHVHWVGDAIPTISSSAIPFSCLQSFPASGASSVSQFFLSGGQSIGASASVLPVNIQDWFP